MRALLLTLMGALLGIARPACAQHLYRDRTATAQINTAADFLYGFHSEQADSTLRRLLPQYGNHPGVVIFQSMILYWRYLPISIYPEPYARYKAMIERAAALSEGMLEKNPNDPEATFFCMMAYSILGRQASEEGESMKAVGYARKAFAHLKKGFELETVYPEFYFSTGIYKYYRERYPEDHPVYKPFLSFFPDGNKPEGLRALETASERGIYTKTEALVLLSGINLHYEMQLPKGLQYAHALVRKYPTNPAFRILYSEALILNGRWQEVPPNAAYAARFPSPFLKAGSAAMMGWYYEKNGDLDKAQASYQDALNKSQPILKAADNFKSIALAGLARLAAKRGDRHKAKQYYRKVMDITNNTLLRNEAHRYLRKIDG